MDKKRRKLSKNHECRLCSSTEAEDYQDAITESVKIGSNRVLLSDLILQVLQVQVNYYFVAAAHSLITYLIFFRSN